MGKRIGKVYLMFIMLFIFISLKTPFLVFANEVNGNNIDKKDPLKYYLGTTVNAGKDKGYSETNKINKKDPHYGWDLGKFYVNGYTRTTEGMDGNPIFLKNVGDKVALWFNLEQNINSLNGDKNLIINEDKNGYDEYFNIDKTNFGRGTLIIRYINHENLTRDPIVYTDYLSANVLTGADTKVELFEEGNYEIALNYEIKNSPRKIFGKDIIPTYTNYKISFKFSVRNGNSMVYPFDVVTKAELIHSAVTENGFYLDLAKSRYLDINVKKEILKEGGNGLIEDIRFNKPAKDGEEYTDEGIYTIEVYNRYTGQETMKKIYVGTNDVLKAYIATGFTIKEIEEQIDQGASIAFDGTIIQPVEERTEEAEDKDSNNISSQESTDNKLRTIIMVGIIVLIIILAVGKITNNKSKKIDDAKSSKDESEGKMK